jgi:hypothetical protein
MQTHGNLYPTLILALLCGVQALAQTDQDTLIQRDLILEKDYVPVIESTDKLLILPETEPLTQKKRNADFSLSGSPAPLKGVYVPLPAPTLITEYPASKKWGYFSFAGGSKTAFLGDAQVNLLRQSKQTLDVRLLHRSIFGDITNSMAETKRSFMNQNRLMGNYTLHLPGHELKVGLGQRYNAWNYYGLWKTPSPITVNDVTTPDNQWLSDSEYAISLASKQTKQALSYNVGLNGHLFYLGKGINAPGTTSKTKGAREGTFNIKGKLAYQLSDNLALGVNAGLTSLSYRNPVTHILYQAFYDNPTSTANAFAKQSWLEVNPYAQFTWKQWKLEAGLNVAIPSLESERVKWAPNLSGSTSLSDKAAFRVSLDGGILVSTYRDGLDRNPYLDPFINLKSAYQPINLEAAIDWRPIKDLRLTPRVGYSRTNNKAFFYNAMPGNTDRINLAYGQLFSALYMNENRLSIGSEAYYNFRSKLRFFAEAHYNQYINYSDNSVIDNLLAGRRKAWYQPGVDARFRLDASPIKQLSLFADYQIMALRYASTSTDFMHRMDDIHDLSLGASWKLGNNVQLFVRLNNLLDQRYEVWNAYKVHGFSALIGGYVTF